MAKPNQFAADFLELILNNVDIALIGDASGVQGSAADGSLYVALHSADPGETGNQTTNELSYTGYSRVAVARNPSSKKWTVTVADPASASNAETVQFGENTGTEQTSAYFSVGTASSGTGKVLYKGTAVQTISNGVIPRFLAGALTITED